VEFYLTGWAARGILRSAMVSLWAVILSVLLAACGAQMPNSLNLPEVREVRIAEAQNGVGIGERVRWGGTISTVVVRQDETCMQIVARPLDERARPRLVDRSDGRFWACSQGFLDPEIYARGRSVTVVGRLTEVREERIGERPYRFPVVRVEQLVLWPRSARTQVRYITPGWYWWDPWFWGPPYVRPR